MFTKTTSLIKLLKGGQLQAKKGGQFGAKIYGQLQAELGDLFKRNLHYIDKKVHKKVNKNSPKNIDINLVSYQYFEGVDLLSIEGVSHSTVLSVMSEVGLEGLKKFETAK